VREREVDQEAYADGEHLADQHRHEIGRDDDRRGVGDETRGLRHRKAEIGLGAQLAAGFVGAVSAAVLASIGLEALGLGPQNEPTVGMTIYWALLFNAPLRGMWWWWGPPILAISYIFVGMFLLSSGLDRIANPKLRTRT